VDANHTTGLPRRHDSFDDFQENLVSYCRCTPYVNIKFSFGDFCCSKRACTHPTINDKLTEGDIQNGIELCTQYKFNNIAEMIYEIGIRKYPTSGWLKERWHSFDQIAPKSNKPVSYSSLDEYDSRNDPYQDSVVSKRVRAHSGDSSSQSPLLGPFDDQVNDKFQLVTAASPNSNDDDMSLTFPSHSTGSTDASPTFDNKHRPFEPLPGTFTSSALHREVTIEPGLVGLQNLGKLAQLHICVFAFAFLEIHIPIPISELA
jgi:hypothetical protein